MSVTVNVTVRLDKKSVQCSAVQEPGPQILKSCTAIIADCSLTLIPTYFTRADYSQLQLVTVMCAVS